ncbi:unnamed protein product [Closterium sp. NIES-53]
MLPGSASTCALKQHAGGPVHRFSYLYPTHLLVAIPSPPLSGPVAASRRHHRRPYTAQSLPLSGPSRLPSLPSRPRRHPAAAQPSRPDAKPPQPPSRRVAESPSRRATQQPSRPTAEPPSSRAARAAQQPRRPSRPAAEPPEPPRRPAVGPLLHLPTCPSPTYSDCAIGQTVSPCSISPLVPLLPRLLLLTALFAHSGPHAMLLPVLLSVRTLATTRELRPWTTSSQFAPPHSPLTSSRSVS